jgi:hypothetical protein
LLPVVSRWLQSEGLRRLSEVSPRVAECACELVERKVIDGRDLTDRMGEVLHTVAEGKLPHSPTMIDARHGESLSRIVTDPESTRRSRSATRQFAPANPERTR